MSQHRYRQKKVKREHSIIEGLLPVLERIASLPGVQSVTPGRINPRSRPGSPGVRFQYVTETGLKLLGRSNAAVQEVFVVTDEPERVLEQLRAEGLVEVARDSGQPPQAEQPRKARRSPDPPQAGAAPAGNRAAPRGAAASSPARIAAAGSEDEPSQEGARGRGDSRGRQAAPGPGRPQARRQRKAARPQKARPPQSPTSVWSEIVERHERLLELERQLGMDGI